MQKKTRRASADFLAVRQTDEVIQRYAVKFGERYRIGKGELPQALFITPVNFALTVQDISDLLL